MGALRLATVIGRHRVINESGTAISFHRLSDSSVCEAFFYVKNAGIFECCALRCMHSLRSHTGGARSVFSPAHVGRKNE